MQPAARESDLLPWRGTARYEVVRCIGHGGMGVVYEAYDRECDRRVAIKTLLRFSPGALYLFKQEFRTLTNVLHRNLVRLYEFVASETDGVFLTMELVSGQDFRTHTLRPEARKDTERPPSTTAGRRPADGASHTSGTRRVERASSPPPPEARAHAAKTPADLDRLRPALRQLAEGVHALHVAGKVHRDIKPSNVLVGDDGRVVLLDFGVAAELARVVDERLLESNVVGTPAYMAPEQALDEGLTTASDWYSVGALLYEALVGKPPFVGDAVDVLYRKSMIEPPSPAELVDGVPEDLDTLCSDLLRRTPEERPTGRQVLRRLGILPNRPLSPTPITGIHHRPPLVGRGGELRALHEAFVAARTRGSVVVRVMGASGMGKSTLVQHFLDGLMSRSDAVILRGCAYERESVAYKAVDGVIDALSRCLMAFEQRGEPISSAGGRMGACVSLPGAPAGRFDRRAARSRRRRPAARAAARVRRCARSSRSSRASVRRSSTSTTFTGATSTARPSFSESCDRPTRRGSCSSSASARASTQRPARSSRNSSSKASTAPTSEASSSSRSGSRMRDVSRSI